MFETEQGSSFLIVKTAVEAAAWEYGTHKVIQGAAYLGGIGFFGRAGSRIVGNGVHVAEGAVVFTQAERAAANMLGFFPEHVVITDGVAEIPIIYMENARPGDVKAVISALKNNGAKFARVNSGPIINPKLLQKFESLHRMGQYRFGLKIYKTNDPGNMFILFGEL